MRRWLVASLPLILLLGSALPASARPAWKQTIDGAIRGHSVSVAVRIGGRLLYSHDPRHQRVPASNEKLILSMALLHELGPRFHLPTFVHSKPTTDSIIGGNIWLVGRGDPSLASGSYASSLSFRATRMGMLARKIQAAGIRAIHGRVMGVVSYFQHDWFARGWKYDFPIKEVALPSALTINGNVVAGRHIVAPELTAARALTSRLRALGVHVWHRAGVGTPPVGLHMLARVTSAPLWALLRHMDRKSSNFFAEVLGKRLGVERFGRPGTIAKGARAISSWAASHGTLVTAYDSSGLSYADRVSPRGMVRLLQVARRSSWGSLLRGLLPAGGQGTLAHRLTHVRLRAKTGTLRSISTLSGWVWLQQLRRWADFSIMDSGMSKDRASAIEDTIVRTLSRYAS